MPEQQEFPGSNHSNSSSVLDVDLGEGNPAAVGRVLLAVGDRDLVDSSHLAEGPVVGSPCWGSTGSSHCRRRKDRVGRSPAVGTQPEAGLGRHRRAGTRWALTYWLMVFKWWFAGNRTRFVEGSWRLFDGQRRVIVCWH